MTWEREREILRDAWQLIKDWPAAAVGLAGLDVALFAWLVALLVLGPLGLLVYGVLSN